MPKARLIVRHSFLVAVLAALVSPGLAASASAAPAAKTTSVVKACAKKKTGEMRLVSNRKKCRANERFLKWNVVGPQGLTGPGGPAGAKGEKGAPGPSHTYWAGSGASVLDLNSTPSPVVSATVPAGKYLVQANTYLFQPTGVVPLLMVCRLLADGEPIDANIVGATLFDVGATGSTSAVPVTLTFTAAATTTVTYACGAAIPGNTVRAQFATMALTQVGAIN